MNKGNPDKYFNFEYIEATVLSGKMHSFHKVLKKSYEIEDTNFNQLDFPINLMMFRDEQFELANELKDKIFTKALLFRNFNVLVLCILCMLSISPINRV